MTFQAPNLAGNPNPTTINNKPGDEILRILLSLGIGGLQGPNQVDGIGRMTGAILQSLMKRDGFDVKL